MDPLIHKPHEEWVTAYAGEAKLEVAGVRALLVDAFVSASGFLGNVAQMDAVFDHHPRFQELRQVAVALVLMNVLAADVDKLESDYLESDAWEAIEEQTIDRGTELLNLLLYFRECADEDIEPQLSDYLKEFLLVDEDEFQD